MKVGRKEGGSSGPAGSRRRTERSEGPSRQRRTPSAGAAGRPRGGVPTRRPRETRSLRPGPQTAPIPRPIERPARPKTASHAKARAKARKAKAPKVIRPSLRDRVIARLVAIEVRPRTLLAKVPFVVLIIFTLGTGLAITLWLSTEAAQRSYQLGNARAVNEALVQQKEALERDVLEAESAPALAEAARGLGMIPSRDTAHLVQDPGGNWVVIGDPKPADGPPPPPLNTELPDPRPAVPPKPAATAPKPGAEVEVLRRITPPTGGPLPATGLETPVRLPAPASENPRSPGGTPHAVPGLTPGLTAGPPPGPLPGPLPGTLPAPLEPLPALPPAATAPVGAAQ